MIDVLIVIYLLTCYVYIGKDFRKLKYIMITGKPEGVSVGHVRVVLALFFIASPISAPIVFFKW